MALQVWLPLNKSGDLSNKGLANVTVTNNGATYNASGKIGGCYKVNGNQLSIPSASYMEMKSGKQFSFACWAKGTTSSGWFIACSGWEIQFQTGHINVYPGGSSNGRDSKFNGTTAADQWRHIAFTWDGSNLILYVDGNAQNTSTFNVSYNISSNINFCYQGERYLNDVRIYDHCLSPKEVKEISKGLVLHYPLNDSATALKSRSTNVTYNQLVNQNPNGYTYTFTSNNSSYYVQIANLNTSITTISGHKYYTRAYISRNISGNNSVYYQLITASGGKAIGTGPANGAPDGYYSNIVTLTGATSNSTYLGIGNYNQKHHFDAGDTVTLKDIVCIDLTTMFGSGNEPTKEDFEKLNLHMLTAYNAGTTMNLKEPVYDSSGYNNNGTITGTLTNVTDSAKYDKSAYFHNNGIITNYSNNGLEEFTYSAWIKLNSYPGERSCISIGGTYFTINSEGKLSGYAYGKAPDNGYVNGTTVIPLNTWTHVALVWTSTQLLGYVNGEVDVTYNCSGTFNRNINPQHCIGSEYGDGSHRIFNGYISDLREYATALSANDIKELYNTAAFIDNHGNVECFQVYEDSDSQVMKTGQVKTGEFKEVSKNLFNKNEVAFNSCNYGSVPNAFTMNSQTGKCTPAKSIPVKPNTWYVLSYDETTVTINSQAFNTTWWDITGKVKVAEDTSGGSLGFRNKVKLKSPANAYFVSFSNFGSLSDANQQILVNSLQLEEGEAFTSYEPHFIDVASVYNNKIECNQLIEI